MKNNWLAVALALAFGIGATYFFMRGRYGKVETNVVIEKYEADMRDARADIDSLTKVIRRIQAERKSDSVTAAIRVVAKQKYIQQLLKQSKDVKAQTYTDPELDSVIDLIVSGYQND